MTWKDYIAAANLGEPILEWRSANEHWLDAVDRPYFIAWTASYVLDAQMTFDDDQESYIDMLSILARNPGTPLVSQIVCWDPDTGELEHHSDVISNTTPKDT